MLTIKATNYRGLQEINWEIPQGLSVLIGPNGAGKSTLLRVVEFLADLVEDENGADAALMLSGGSTTLKNKRSTTNAVSFDVQLGELQWQLRLVPQGRGIAPYPYEKLSHQSQTIYERISGVNNGKVFINQTNPLLKGQEIAVDGNSALKMLSRYDKAFVGNPLRNLLLSYQVFGDYELNAARNGSEDIEDDQLHPYGQNVFSLLRNWDNVLEDRGRRRFVVENLRECFPFFYEIEFGPGNGKVEGFFRHKEYPDKSDKFPMRAAPNGFLTAMMHLCAVAGANAGEIICIDDFESCLHPEAITTLLRKIEEEANAKEIAVVLATQSPQVLNFFDDKPERVYVVDDRLRPSPRPLIEVKNPDWLSHFHLGEKFMGGSFAGSKVKA